MGKNKVTASGAASAVEVTPSDSTTYTPMLDALYVGGAGNVAIVDGEGNTIDFVGVVAGTILPVNASKVNSTDTTATSIVGLRY